MIETGSIINYGDHALQQIKFFRYLPENSRAIVLLHGGAWRDPNNTYDDFQELNQHFNQHSVNDVNIIGINYRLSPEFTHPTHLYDVFLALQFIDKTVSPTSILMVGHSVGATLMLQLLNYVRIMKLGGKNVAADFSGVLNKIDTMYFVDGIYDIPALIKEYGEGYKEFVTMAFGEGHTLEGATQMGLADFEGFAHFPKKFVVVHSQQDELLSMQQPDIFVEFLQQNGVQATVVKGAWGKHEEVYRRVELAQLISREEAAFSN